MPTDCYAGGKACRSHVGANSFSADGESNAEEMPSCYELFAQRPRFQIVLGVEQQRDGAFAGFVNRHFDHIANFMRIGVGAD